MNHLIIGLGGTGGKSIRSLRKLVFAERGSEGLEPSKSNLEYLYVDSSAEMMSQTDPSWKVLGTSVQLSSGSQLKISGEDLERLLVNINNYPGIRPWIGSETIWQEILGTIVGEALGGQKRRLGRFLFARHVTAFNNTVNSLVRNLQSNGVSSLNFHVIAGLAGGTGSGSILDVITQLRKNYPDSLKYKITPYLLLPDQYPPPNWDTGNYHANGFAALTEINALSTGSLIPVDIENGNHLALKDPFNGAYILSNENENGYIANIGEEIPQIIAEFLYQKVFIAGTVGLASIARIENAENGDGTPEINPSNGLAQRSKRFMSYGMKRITIPEEEIKEYLTLTFAKQCIQQLRFNNWQESLGYVAEPVNFDVNAIVKSAVAQSDWKISDSYLLLEETILGSDDPRKQWKSIHSEWESVCAAYKQLAQENDPKQWLTSLTSSFQNRFDESYRNLGVKEFYRTKNLAKLDMAREIRKIVEQNLLASWKDGERSFYDVLRIIDGLVQLLEEKISFFENQSTKSEQRLDETRLQISNNIAEWTSIGFLGKVLGKNNNIFERHAQLLQTLFTDLTRIEAFNFAKSLLTTLISEIIDLKAVTEHFSAVVNNASDSISKDLEQRLANTCETDAKAHVVRYFDADVVRKSAKELTSDEVIQKTHAASVRSTILSKIGADASISKLDKTLNLVQLIDTITSSSEQGALTAHSNNVLDPKKKILGISIIDKFEERYSNDTAALRLKIHDLLSKAGAFLTINPSERDKVAPGIPAGAQVLVTKTIIILPKRREQGGFVDELKNAFKAAMNGDIEFVETDHQQNEITILTLKNLFPLRMVGILPFLQQKYSERIKIDEKRYSMELQTSGTLGDYPSLFSPNAADLKLSAGENILLGISLGIIIKSAKGTYLLVSKDDDGFDNPPIELANTIIESVSKVDFEISNILDKQVSSLIGNINNSAEIEERIKALIEETKTQDGFDISSRAYQQLVESAKGSFKRLRGAI